MPRWNWGPTRWAPPIGRRPSAASWEGAPAATNRARPISSRRSAGIFGIFRSSLCAVADDTPPRPGPATREDLRLLRALHSELDATARSGQAGFGLVASLGNQSRRGPIISLEKATGGPPPL